MSKSFNGATKKTRQCKRSLNRFIENFNRKVIGKRFYVLKINFEKTAEILRVINEKTDKLTKQTKTRPHGDLEFKLTKLIETFSANALLELEEEENQMLQLI